MNFAAGGKLYLFHSEHSANQPLPRGAPAVCLNATTGEVIWRINGAFRQTRWGGRAIIGDSVIATMDTYDQSVYAIGKGPSALTVTAPDMGVPFGSSVMIRGTVMDVSPGTEDAGIKMRFPKGVPAVSDASMSDWMEYVYMQKPCPTNVKGVPVSIDVLDSNGNYRNIGTATSDVSGKFSFTWTPDIPGDFTVIATDGSHIEAWLSASKRFVADPSKKKIISLADRLIDWEIIKYAKEKGIREFDLGGIWPEEEAAQDIVKKGINDFKLRSGGKVVTRYLYQKTYSKTFSLVSNFYGLKNLAKTSKYGHEEWLPKSKYEEADWFEFEFELYDERFIDIDDPKSEIDIYIPIREKITIKASYLIIV
jgi:hypothetical protein